MHTLPVPSNRSGVIIIIMIVIIIIIIMIMIIISTIIMIIVIITGALEQVGRLEVLGVGHLQLLEGVCDGLDVLAHRERRLRLLDLRDDVRLDLVAQLAEDDAVLRNSSMP